MRYKFELGGSYIYYFGNTLGEAIEAFIKHRPTRVREITNVVKEPIKDCET